MTATPSDLASRIVAEAADAIMSCDVNGVITLWNAGAERVFGFGAAEAIGKSLDIIVPERQRQRHWDGWNRALEAGRSRYGAGELLAVPALRKDGSTISIEFTIVMLRDGGGAVSGVAAIVRDVTARWQREKELRARMKELESRASAAG
jgi:PAS domain S-box-containing protein